MNRSFAICLFAATLAGVPARAQQGAGAANPVYRGLLLGIDAYTNVTPLKGSVADIRDLEASLRGIGATDVKVMLDGAATRGSVLAEFNAMIDRTRPGDTVFLSVSGHGAQEPERVKGSEADGMDTVFLLAGFDPLNRDHYGEKIVDKEFNHFVKQIEDKGARVVFIADTCSGGGLARDVDPRAAEMSYRSVKYKALADDPLVVINTRPEAFMTPTDFKKSNFLAAVDRKSKSPEIKVPGLGFRGALSYAVARGLEGAADLNGDGVVTTAELFEYTKRVTYQLSDQRQTIVTAAAQGIDPVSDVIVRFDRGIGVRPTTDAAVPTTAAINPTTATPTAQPAATGPKPTVLVARPTGAAGSSPPTVPTAPAVAGKPAPVALSAGTTAPIRVASRDSRSNPFTGLSVQTKIEVVAPDANPDIVWDPATRDVIAGGDVIARNVERDGLPAVIERTAALRQIKVHVLRSPQAIRIGPDDKLHHKGVRVEVEVSGLVGKSLVLFNLSGDGTVQMIYPKGSDPAVRTEATYRLPLQVRDPLGADEVVALVSSHRMPELEQGLKNLDGRKNPVKIAELINQYALSDVSVGSAGLFTAP